MNAGMKRSSTEIENTSGRVRDHQKRIEDLENQIKLLKSLGAPAGGDGVSPGMMDALTEMINQLRKDTEDKLHQ